MTSILVKKKTRRNNEDNNNKKKSKKGVLFSRCVKFQALDTERVSGKETAATHKGKHVQGKQTNKQKATSTEQKSVVNVKMMKKEGDHEKKNGKALAKH